MPDSLLVTILLIALFAGCHDEQLTNNHSGKSGMRMLEDSGDMQKEVLTLVPVGTSIEQARAIMEKNGFDCSLSQDEESGAKRLYCVLERTWKWPVSRKWQIRFQYDDTGVTKILVDSGLVGP
jgi:hypothetical protein